MKVEKYLLGIALLSSLSSFSSQAATVKRQEKYRLTWTCQNMHNPDVPVSATTCQGISANWLSKINCGPSHVNCVATGSIAKCSAESTHCMLPTQTDSCPAGTVGRGADLNAGDNWGSAATIVLNMTDSPMDDLNVCRWKDEIPVGSSSVPVGTSQGSPGKASNSGN